VVTRVFLDTEFLDDGDRIDLISIALVAGTGPEYYAISADCRLDRVLGHGWLRANVVPHLPLRLRVGGREWDPGHPEYACIRSRYQIAADVQAFLAGLPAPEIWAFFSPYDTVALCQLYGPMSELPAHVPGFTRDLKQEAERQRIELPGQPEPVHHALADARHDLVIAAVLGLLV